MNHYAYTSDLDGLRPIIWYGQAVHTRYAQLKAILNERLGAQHAALLSEPFVPREALDGHLEAKWFSETVREGKPLNKLPEKKQQQLKDKLAELLAEIATLAKSLKGDEREDLRQIGELLGLAMEVPSFEYVRSDGQELCLICWGFSVDIAEKSHFRLSKALSHAPASAPMDASIPPAAPSPQPNPAPQPAGLRSKKGIFIAIGAALFILCLSIFWLLQKASTASGLPPTPGLVPIDPQAVTQMPGDLYQRQIVAGRLSVYLEPGRDLEAFAAAFRKKYPKGDFDFVGYRPRFGVLQVETPEDQMDQWRSRFRDEPWVSEVVFDFIHEVKRIPNDPAFQTGEVLQYWGLNDIGAIKAWETTRGRSDVVIAVIDSGFDLEHPELMGRYKAPWNVTDNRGLLSRDPEWMYHGTIVAAIALGNVDNASGSGGVCPECTLLPVQVMGPGGHISQTALLEGLAYAMDQGADVINLSLGIPVRDVDPETLSDQEKQRYLNTLQRDPDYVAMKRIWDRNFQMIAEAGCVIVQSAGNQNMLSRVDPKKDVAYAINVAATNQAHEKADFSNYGDSVTLCAPGEGIYSAVPGAGFEPSDGTSMSAPFVSGAVGLLKSLNPDLTYQEIKALLLETGQTLPSSHGDHAVGPLLQVDAALFRLQSPPIPEGECPCEHEIAVLRGELEDLRSKVLNLESDVSGPIKLVIPKTPNGFQFAEGTWRSSKDLSSTVDDQPIMLYFNFNPSGEGQMTLVEHDGTRCFSDVNLDFQEHRLIINQHSGVSCPDKNYEYSPYSFECVSEDGRAANCVAIRTNDNGATPIHFQLFKQ